MVKLGPAVISESRQTFAQEGDRIRLSGTALKAFSRLAEAWTLTNSEAAALIGVSESTWDRMKRGRRAEILSQDQFTRVSAMVGIFKGLHLLFVDDMADRWPRLANKGPLFENSSPIETMIEGGIPQMLEIRRHIDAVRGGL
jgi:hypothetical protein